MPTKLLNDQQANSPWNELLGFKHEQEAVEYDAQMLMFRFLSEVEKHQELQSINKKTLAQKIKTSASYITQLFRGNKPLNFETLAKMQKALNIRFYITAKPVQDKMQMNESAALELLNYYNTHKDGTWYYKKHFSGVSREMFTNANHTTGLLKNMADYHGDKVIPA